MPVEKKDSLHILNIIRRSMLLVGSVKRMGADTSKAEQLIRDAKAAADAEEYETAVELAKSSMLEVMRLKTELEKGRADGTVEGAPAAASAPSSQPAAKPAPSRAKAPSGGTLPAITEGFSYLVEEERVEKCFSLLEGYLGTAGIQALLISRTNPRQLRKLYKYPEDSAKILWLTDREGSGSDTITPSLENMIFVLEEFIDENDKTALLIDGIEYLISNNTFNSVLRFLRRIVDKVSESDSLLLVAISPGAIAVQDLKQLEREMQPLKV